MRHYRLGGRRSITFLRERLADESGVALVMALGMMLVLSVMVTSSISLTSANARGASRSNADQKALALAEAGLSSALSVLHSTYPGAYPGDGTLLPQRTSTHGDGSVTWSGTLAGPLPGAGGYEWRLSSRSTVRNPTGPGSAPVARTVSVVVPVVKPPTTPATAASVLNWIYSGTDTHFTQSVQIGSPVYATRDLFLANTAKIRGSARKLVVGRDLHLTAPQNRVGLVSGLTPADPRIEEAHVVHQCSSHANPVLHPCLWDADLVLATVHDNVIPPTLVIAPTMTCCAPYAGSIAPAGSATESNMGWSYKYAELGPLSPCDPATRSGTPPTFESVGNIAIDNSATPSTAFNLTPTASYTCKTLPGAPTPGELSWNAATKVLTVKGTIFIDGSATVTNSGAPATYVGQATLVLSGTFMMKNSKICAVVASGDCDLTAGAWNPNTRALVIVADGDASGGGAQAQGGEVSVGEGIHLKGSSFQGALMANKNVKEETSCAVQGPMISVYNEVWGGQTCAMSFPVISFAPIGVETFARGTSKATLLEPQAFGG